MVEVSKKEFEELKKEVKELKEDLVDVDKVLSEEDIKSLDDVEKEFEKDKKVKL